MHINGSARLIPIAPSLPTPDIELTPDTIYAYCSVCLRNLGARMAERMERQQASIETKRILDKCSQALRLAPRGTGTDKDLALKVTAQFDEAFAELERVDPDLANRLRPTRDNLARTVAEDQCIGEDENKGFMEHVDSFHKQVDDESELGMIEMQTLMSQRQTAISLTTNLLQSFGNQTNTIVANIGK